MTGASLMPAIVAEMQAQGYYAHLHLAKSSVIQKLTVLGLKRVTSTVMGVRQEVLREVTS